MKLATFAISPLCNLWFVVFGAAAADLTATWNNTTGNWSDATRWSTNPLFPNNGNGGFTYDTVINSGAVTLDQSIAIEAFNLTGGTLTGAATNFTLTLDDVLTWTAGTIGGPGTIRAMGDIVMKGTSSKTLGNGGNTGRTLINDDVANLSDGSLFIRSSEGANPGSKFQNNGTFNAADEADILCTNNGGSPGSFTNAGTFNKSGPGTTTEIFTPFTNSGTVDVNSGTLSFNGSYTQTNGNLTLNGGVVSASSTLDIQGGSVNGSGTIHGSVSNSGTVAPGFSAGGTTIDGGYSQLNSGGLRIGLGGTAAETEFDVLRVTGGTTLAGTLDVSLINSFTPASGNSFQIVTSAGNISGIFAYEFLPALPGGLFLDVVYSQHDVVLVTQGVLGDYNRNGAVDAADYALWRKTLGQIGPGLASDGDGDTQIDSDDFNIWRAHFGQTAGSGSGGSANVAVPEPPALLLLMLAATAAWLLRRRAA